MVTPHQPQNELFSLRGKVVLLTGAAGGVGASIAVTMAANGATLLLTDQDITASEELANVLRLAGSEADALPCDLSQHRQVETLAAAALAYHGRVDVLVCNAGVPGPVGPMHEVRPNAWRYVMDVNLQSAASLTSTIVPAMARQGGGSVILMSSIAALRGNSSIGLYGMSKAALSQLARNLAVEWGQHNVRANAIAPGLIRTPFASGMLSDQAFMARRIAATPLRRPGEPHEIAGVAVMLASPAGQFISGQTIVVDGGTTISDGS